uniref:Secreted protein n=1 Tax=Globodera pallida TaxID=36090 RepID=A0A183CQL6_GLOPA
MTKSLLFPCWCDIIFCLALMAEDKNVLALSNDGVEPRIARYFEEGKLVRVKRACGEDRCSVTYVVLVLEAFAVRPRAEVCKRACRAASGSERN